MEIRKGGIIIRTQDGRTDDCEKLPSIIIFDTVTNRAICKLNVIGLNFFHQHKKSNRHFIEHLGFEEVPIESTKYPTEMENAKMLYEFAKLLESYTPEQRDALGKELAKDCVADMQSRTAAIKQITQTDQ